MRREGLRLLKPRRVSRRARAQRETARGLLACGVRHETGAPPEPGDQHEQDVKPEAEHGVRHEHGVPRSTSRVTSPSTRTETDMETGSSTRAVLSTGMATSRKTGDQPEHEQADRHKDGAHREDGRTRRP